jgi:hypothetical protein
MEAEKDRPRVVQYGLQGAGACKLKEPALKRSGRLFESVKRLCRTSPCCAFAEEPLVDALRLRRARERKIAETELRQRLMKVPNA